MAFARSGERLKSLFSAQDMSKGAPWKRILEFSLPMLIGNLAQQMYNTADSVIVGYYVGDNALAAVGSASPILNLLLALFVGVSTGAGILVAQYYGAREKENLSNVIGNCMTLTIIVSAIIMIIGPLVTRPLLSLLGTPESIFNWCSDYLIIYFLGILGFAAYNIFRFPARFRSLTDESLDEEAVAALKEEIAQKENKSKSEIIKELITRAYWAIQ